MKKLLIWFGFIFWIFIFLQDSVFAQITLQNILLKRQYESLLSRIPKWLSEEDVARINMKLLNLEEEYSILDTYTGRGIKDLQYKTHLANSRKILLELNRILRAISNQSSWNSIKWESWDTVTPLFFGSPVESIQQKSTSISFYADKFEWGNTSNGEIFSQWNFSAATCIYPLWSLVQIHTTTKSVVAKVNDRMNCSKFPSAIDLSKQWFSVLDALSKWRIEGNSILLTDSLPRGYVKKYLNTNTFQDLWVLLDQQQPNTYIASEKVKISWKIINNASEGIIFFRSPSWKEIPMPLNIWIGGSFEYEFLPTENGEYTLILSSGRSFETSLFEKIYVFPRNIFSSLLYSINSKTNKYTLSSIHISHDENSNIHINLPEKNIFYVVTIKQNNKTLIRSGRGGVIFWKEDLLGFKEGNSHVIIDAFLTSTPFSHDMSSYIGRVFDSDTLFSYGYQSTLRWSAEIYRQWNQWVIQFTSGRDVRLKCDYDIMDPKWQVHKYSFSQSYCSNGESINMWKLIKTTFPMEYDWVYLVEVNDIEGKAYLNIPITRWSSLQILPNPAYSISKKIRSDIDSIRKYGLTSINQLRKLQWLSSLKLDDTLNFLAQKKSEDMAENNSISHMDSYGWNIGSTAKRLWLILTGHLWENVAGWNIGDMYLLELLKFSPAHLSSMINPGFSKLGIGQSIQDGKVFYVQVFWD